ncbi:hypothetical protein MTO96_048454 [Rhipicephalus appendiculatus]
MMTSMPDVMSPDFGVIRDPRSETMSNDRAGVCVLSTEARLRDAQDPGSELRARCSPRSPSHRRPIFIGLTDLPQAIKAAESGSSAEHDPDQVRSRDSSPDGHVMPQVRQHNREVPPVNASHRAMHYPDSSATTELSSDLV